MAQNPMKNSFFILSFAPAFLYWYLESYYPIKTAILGGIILACAEIILERLIIKEVHTISKLNFFLMLLMGSVAFIKEDGLLFKLWPGVMSFVMAIFMLVLLLKKRPVLLHLFKSMPQNRLPDFLILELEKHFIIFLFLYAILMIGMAFYTTSWWLFFKTLGLYILMFLFMIFEIMYLRLSLKKMSENARYLEILSKMRSK